MCSNILPNNESFDKLSDNVCEIILSYLSASDKLKFECVSKQWQSLIFTKHQKIIINESYRQVIDTVEVSHEFWLKYEKSIIECLTKKFKFLTKLQINFEINKQLFEIITKNSENLRKIKFFGFLGQDNCEKFGQIRG